MTMVGLCNCSPIVRLVSDGGINTGKFHFSPVVSLFVANRHQQEIRIRPSVLRIQCFYLLKIIYLQSRLLGDYLYTNVVK